ncbi:MAG: ANTAR domain-containing protein, partial [Defluviitaleaceae bacterium]|nr:ANTAR domain-containing protein [Defluviitaleaceae bacterium]
LVVIDFPLQDESGEDLARHISANGVAQVILVVPSQFYDAISNLCEDDGVLVISKPINKKILWLTLKLARSVHARLALLRTENLKLKQRVEDIRLASRAKWLLVSYLGVSEPEAHRHIEKQAMDLRLPKRVIAEGIIKTYENL